MNGEIDVKAAAVSTPEISANSRQKMSDRHVGEAKTNDTRLTICSADHNDSDLVRAVQAQMLPATTAANVAELFKALADPTRIRIISILAHAEMCVGDLCIALEMNQPAVSYQLRILRTLRIVRARKVGKHVFYTLDDDHVYQLYHQGVEHIEHA